MKNCRKCKQDKPATEFHKSNSTRDRLNIYCKECNREIKRKRRLVVKEFEIKFI